jgi:hypothetical protein
MHTGRSRLTGLKTLAHRYLEIDIRYRTPDIRVLSALRAYFRPIFGLQYDWPALSHTDVAILSA